MRVSSGDSATCQYVSGGPTTAVSRPFRSNQNESGSILRFGTENEGPIVRHADLTAAIEQRNWVAERGPGSHVEPLCNDAPGLLAEKVIVQRPRVTADRELTVGNDDARPRVGSIERRQVDGAFLKVVGARVIQEPIAVGKKYRISM